MKKKKLLELLQKSPNVRKAKAESDLAFFARYYLASHIKTKVGQLHKEWISKMRTCKGAAIAAPRGHAKSSWWSLVYPLYCILFRKKRFIVIMSDTLDQAQKLLGEIIEQLETNETIIKDFGKIAGYIPKPAEEKKKWSASEINTTTGVRVIAVSWTSKIRGIKASGNRPDLVILDDVENDINVQSEDQRAKMKNMFRKVILNLPDPNVFSQTFVVGTILHFDSLLQWLINNPIPKWFTKLYTAIGENNKVLWSEWWSLDKLEEKRKEIGDISFQQEYMNNPLDPTVQIIKPQAYYEAIDMSFMTCYGYMDLAISEKETADYTTFVTIGRHNDTGELYIIDPQRLRGDITKQMELAFEMYNKYNHIIIGVESVSYQKAFAQVLRMESNKRGLYLPVQEIEIDKDKVRRVQEIVPHIDNGTVKFNKLYQDFMAECIQFPKAAHDDFVDAFAGAVKLAIISHSSSKVYSAKGLNYPKNY